MEEIPFITPEDFPYLNRGHAQLVVKDVDKKVSDLVSEARKLLKNFDDLLEKYKKLKAFCLARCWCKSIPGAEACSYCDVVFGTLDEKGK